jgi:hypothetical protein
MGNMMGERLSFVTGFSRNGLVGKYDVADDGRPSDCGLNWK